jgi:rare lipoprotein A
MRTTITVSTFALAALTVAAAPASAAWTCDGPAYVCGSPVSHQKVSKTRVSHKVYNKTSVSRVAYQGERRHYAEAPVRRRHYAEAPVRKHRSYAPSYAEGGSSSAGGGIASYYASGSMTASGARFNPEGLTAAHRTLPFGTRVLVTNRANGQSVVVTINDRGPFVGGRVIDLSRGAARAINMGGLAPVTLVVLGRG